MEYTYHDQAPTKTLTVGQLIKRLLDLDPEAPVIFRSPLHGVFGSNQAYPLHTVEAVTMPRKEHLNPGGVCIDEETEEEFSYESHTQVWPAWTGVVISCNS